MSGQRGFYAIIQYWPRIERAEGINVGVALFCEGMAGAMVRMVRSNERVRARFPDLRLDEERFNSDKAAFDRRLRRHRIQAPEELRDFMGREAGHLVLMPPCPILVRSPVQDLDELFDDLVGEPGKREKRRPEPPNIDAVFERLLGAYQIRRNVEVELPSVGKLLAPWVYRNAVDNHVKPHGFGPSLGSSLAAAKHLALMGQVLHRHPLENVERRLVVVASFGDEEAIPSVRSLLTDCNVRLVVQAELPTFAEEVEQHAHPIEAQPLVLSPPSGRPRASSKPN
jgi:Protein of unknown function (DUF3037)